jgi:DNA mismatch repair ATPase MutS
MEQAVNVVKQGIDPLLSVSRDIYKENIDDLYSYISEVEEELDIKCTLHYEVSKGFVFKISDVEFLKIEQRKDSKTLFKRRCKDINLTRLNYSYDDEGKTLNSSVNRSTINSKKTTSESDAKDYKRSTLNEVSDKNSTSERGPGEIIILSRKKDFVFITTLEMQGINARIEDAFNQIIQISGKICMNEQLKIRKYIKAIQAISEKVANVDVVLSFYIFSKKYRCCIPEFGDSLIANDICHIFVEKKGSICNSIYSCPMMSFNTITGSNMSGKTTYIKSIGLYLLR